MTDRTPSAARTLGTQVGQGWMTGVYATCPNCKMTVAVGYAHPCPALRDLSPMGGGPRV